MVKYLFLDIDGVLIDKSSDENKEWLADNFKAFTPACVQALNKIVEATNCQIVITSTWKDGKTVERLRKVFTLRGFLYPDNIIGKTITIVPETFGSHKYVDIPRGSEIRQWIKANVSDTGAAPSKVEGIDYTYAIVDDNDDMLYEQRNCFVQVPYITGLTDQLAERVIVTLS